MIHQKHGVFPAVCPLDCPDTCSLLLHKENGKIVKVTGNPDHPITQGAICNKVRNMAHRVYHPERVLYPLRRTGPKGAGSFERISWDEAIREIADRYKALIASDGPESILPYSFYGNMGILSVDGMDRRFFNRLGASKLKQSICNSAGNEGWKSVMGFNGGTVPEDTVNADVIIVWGGNIVSTNMHQVVLAEKARKRGAKVVVIDVHKNQTGQWADWFIPLYPGTDAALAVGIMHVLFRDGLVDEAFMERYTIGHEELREHVKTYTPEYVSSVTGIPADDVAKLAELYGRAGVSYIHIGNGLQHHDNGGMTVRSIAALPALTGQWLKRGGGAAKSNGGYNSMNSEALERPDLRPNPGARTINMNRIGEALAMTEKPIRSVFVYCSNPLVVAPDTERVREGFAREDLFTVVHDLFMTDTAKYADIVLPATSSFESTDLYASYWHQYVQLQEPVIPAQGESKSNVELFSLLGRAMGFEEEAFRESEEEMIARALDNPDNPYLNGVTLDRLKAERHVKLDMTPLESFLDRLPTPSGRIELYSARLAEAKLPPLPTYVPLKEGYDGVRRGRGNRYPLMFISPPNHNFLNSTFANVEKHQKMEKEPTLQIHPEDAEQRGIADGDPIVVFNDRGTYEARAKVVDKMLPGTVVSQGLWWEGEGRKQRANALTPDRLADMGEGATFFSTVVEIKRT
ncbi:molybdopterin-containing oxidoreductase family protein [Paenibacillus lactis]|uniref:Anaerobic selenocysteine-containing dehydrogenase n=1 Tax=Paenibacillus lactis TaxID=228574 RepID=A0ABS4F4D1_9BACL|nr:molybdopterin oxidoreductase family protein [Paenibacillus lactis]MBP1891112.1 anaerobic selenocysteine-containing dehydrogenase [Paenibacillus lactis]MCM3493566.1 molybdopterin oxidoreductase family protein [Paenibacillus lactis]HAG00465.1 oxidoreductase [Paenibacillus lactis]